jgi:hypothetical protein
MESTRDSGAGGMALTSGSGKKKESGSSSKGGHTVSNWEDSSSFIIGFGSEER